MFDNFDNLWHHYNSLNDFFNIVCIRLELNSGVVVLDDLGFAWNLECFDFGLVDNYLSENFFGYLFFDELFGLVDDLLDDFFDNFDLSMMMDFFLHFFDLINNGSDGHISIGLDFDRDFLIMDVMLRSVDFNKVWLFDDFGDMNGEGSFMILVYNFIHVEVDLFGDFDGVLDLDDFFPQ